MLKNLVGCALNVKTKAEADDIVRNDSVRSSVRTEKGRIHEPDIIKSAAELQAATRTTGIDSFYHALNP